MRDIDPVTDEAGKPDLAALESFFDSISDLLAVVDREGRIQRANRAWERALDQGPDALRGRALADLLEPEDGAQMRAALRSLHAAGNARSLTARMRYHGSAVHWLEWNLSAAPTDGLVHVSARDITERHDRHEALEKLALVAQHMTNHVVMVDAQHRITWVNAAFEARSGYSLREVIGKNPGDLTRCDATDPATIAHLTEAMERGEPVGAEILNQSRDGVQYWVDLNIHPMRDAAGSLTGFVSVETDITERKAYEQATTTAHNRLQATLQALPDLLLEVDADGRYVDYHCSDFSAYPIPPEAFMGRTLEEVLPPEVAAQRRAIMREVDKAGRTMGHEYRLDLGNGTRWMEASAARRVSDDPRVPPGYLFVTRDITARVEAREALRYRDALLQGLFELSPIGLALNDFETGAFVDVNPALLVATGYTRDELVGRSYLDITPPGHDASEAKAQDDLRKSGRYDPFEKEYIRKDGAKVPVRVSGILLKDADGRAMIWSLIEDISERRKQEAALNALADEAQEARQRLFNAVEALPDAFVHYDADDRLVMCNERYREFYPQMAELIVPGARFEDIVRAGLERGVYAVEPGTEEEWLKTSLQAHLGSGRELEVPLADGRWLRMIDKPTFDGGRVGMRVDITARKEAEQRIDDIISGAQVGTWHADFRTGENRINERWAQILGYSLEELQNISENAFRKLIHPDDLAMLEALQERRLSSGADRFENEFRMRHRDGRWIWVLSRGRVIARDADGEPLEMSGVHLDVTGRKELEAALKAEHDYLARLMETSISGILVQNGDGAITFANAEAERLLGLSRARGGGPDYDRPLWRMTGLDRGPLPTEDRPFERVMSTGKPVRDLRCTIEWPDGGFRFVSFNAAPVTVASRPARVVLSVTDITAQVDAETALRKSAARAEAANRAKSSFLANISHEIRTPLNGVLGMAELLDEVLEDPSHRRMIHSIRDSGHLLLETLNDVLDMSKIEAGKLSIESIPFRPSDLLTRVESLHGMRARDKGLEFSLRMDAAAEVPRIGDPHRILQVLNNLVSNAIKFTVHGKVEVRLAADSGTSVSVEVRDTGIGMTPAQLSRLFEAFTQADDTVSRRFGGTGLGMSIVRRLVSMMNGEIRVNSAEGEGTFVRLTLPLALSDSLAAPADESPPPVHLLKGLRALAADDNATNRKILQAMLSRLGVEVTLARDGREAVDAWEPGRFDVLLLDISMPVMDGFTALRAIRDRAEAAGVASPAIAITAHAMAHQVADHLAGGFDAHVAKPFRRDDLAREILRLTRTG